MWERKKDKRFTMSSKKLILFVAFACLLEMMLLGRCNMADEKVTRQLEESKHTEIRNHRGHHFLMQFVG